MRISPQRVGRQCTYFVPANKRVINPLFQFILLTQVLATFPVDYPGLIPAGHVPPEWRTMG